jgi:ribosomal-protein-alanine N-acetyltransferase
MEPPNGLRFRTAHRSEARLIASLSRLHVEHGLRWRWTPAKVRRQIDDPDCVVLIASFSGDITGFAIMHFGDRDAHLLLLAVQPLHRRHGIGRALLEWLEKSCRIAGIESIRLEVRAGNQPARAFYRACGFRDLTRISGYYDRQEAAIAMTKSLLVRRAQAG